MNRRSLIRMFSKNLHKRYVVLINCICLIITGVYFSLFWYSDVRPTDGRNSFTKSVYLKDTDYPWLSSESIKSENRIVADGMTTPDELERLFGEAYTAKRVFYNRVPKCGSEGVVSAVKRIAKVRLFDLIRSYDFKHKYLNDSQELEMVQYINRLPAPVFYDRHVGFANFTKFNVDMPVYINVIRDPVERFISFFYHDKNKCSDKECTQLTIEHCLAEKRSLCFEDSPRIKDNMWTTVPYFCGYRSVCKNRSREALEQAKRNAARYYLAIGILEELESFYYVLDRSVPHFFKGIHKSYLDRKNEETHIHHSTSHKPNTSIEAKEKLKPMFDLEYEFYEFAKQLLKQRINYINSDGFKNKTIE